MIMSWTQIRQLIMLGNQPVEAKQAQRALCSQSDVPRKAIEYLERILRDQGTHATDQPELVDEWIQHYQDIVRCLASIKQDVVSVSKIQTTLKKGKIDAVSALLNQLIVTEARSSKSQAALYYCCGKMSLLAMQPDQGLTNLQKAHQLMSESFDYTFDLAGVLCQQKHYDTSETLYITLLHANESAMEVQRAAILAKLGFLYAETQRETEAEFAYVSALKIYETLAAQNNKYVPVTGMILHRLASLYRSTQRFVYAEESYDEALVIYRRLAEKTTEYRITVASMLNELADLWREVGALEKLSAIETQITELEV